MSLEQVFARYGKTHLQLVGAEEENARLRQANANLSKQLQDALRAKADTDERWTAHLTICPLDSMSMKINAEDKTETASASA